MQVTVSWLDSSGCSVMCILHLISMPDLLYTPPSPPGCLESTSNSPCLNRTRRPDPPSTPSSVNALASSYTPSRPPDCTFSAPPDLSPSLHPSCPPHLNCPGHSWARQEPPNSSAPIHSAQPLSPPTRQPGRSFKNSHHHTSLLTTLQ